MSVRRFGPPPKLLPEDWPSPLPILPAGRYWTAPAAADGHPVFCIGDADPFDHHHFRLRRVLHVGRTAFRRVMIADTYSFGRMLLLDGSVQSAESDEKLYHEMLVQPAMLAHDRPADVLIIGGADGATLREVLAHPSVRRATLVEPDRELVGLCRDYLPCWQRGAFEDPRTRLHFGDGRRFVEEHDERYDVILVGGVDRLGDGPAQALHTREFYSTLRRRLRPGGVLAVQGLEFSFLDFKGHSALNRTLRSVFSHVASYRAAIPSFLSTRGFLIASDEVPIGEVEAASLDARIAERLGASWLEHADGAFIRAAFCHDKETRFLLSLPGPILEDDIPFLPPPDIADSRTFEPAFPAQPA